MTDDPVNHPAHYTRGKIEVIDFIEDQKFGYHLGQVVKYVARAGYKNPTDRLQDLQKARWYLEREIGMTARPLPQEVTDMMWDAYSKDMRARARE